MLDNSLRSHLLGNSKVQISIIGQGTGGLGGYFTPDTTEDEQVIKGLRTGLDLGMNFIDTAEIYGGGHTEELVGRAISGRRSEVIVATKFSPENSTPKSIIAAAESSLRRLNTDYIDLYQTHWPSSKTPLEEILDTMRTLVKQGKVRWLGLSNVTARDLSFSIDYLGLDMLVSVQGEYNLLERSAETEVFDLCNKHNLTFLAYSPLLSGRSFQKHNGYSQMAQIASRYGVSIFCLMLTWLVARDHVVAIPRSSKTPHIHDNAMAANLQLKPEDKVIIGDLFSAKILCIDTNMINVIDADDRNVYKTLNEAIANNNHMDPSPVEMAEQFRSGEVPKKIKLRKLKNGRYALVEGRLKYWGWVIAFEHSKPIPAIIEN